jgi:amino acid permease
MRENNMKIILALAFIFICFVNIFGQAKTVSKDEITTVFDKWKQHSKQKTYRIKTVSEFGVNGISNTGLSYKKWKSQ